MGTSNILIEVIVGWIFFWKHIGTYLCTEIFCIRVFLGLRVHIFLALGQPNCVRQASRPCRVKKQKREDQDFRIRIPQHIKRPD